MKKVKVCECCGHPLPDNSMESSLTPSQKRLFGIVRRAGTGGIAVADIMDVLYAQRSDGGPDSRNIVCVMAKQMRARLEVSGVTIVATRGPGSRYFIVPIERKAEFDVRSRWTKRRQKIREARVV